jgi:hypothetical protein
VKRRLNVFLPSEYAVQLAEIAAVKRVSKSSLVAVALANFLSPEMAESRERATARRMEKLIREVVRLGRRQEVSIETLALFIRHTLATTTPVPEEQQQAARAQGHARFSEFIEQLGRHLQRGTSAFAQVYERLDASDAESYFQDGAGASS